ncbi:MAG: histidine phosphatase family protein [Actinomycetota bacterium]|nr:histidine phosphatase family protein [Actinomycetota bacterium]
MTAKRLILMRHGQTEASAHRIYSGKLEIPLTAEGRAQAERAADSLRESGLDAIRSSPLSRARETAEAVARAVGLPVLVDERLREIDYGPVEGLDRAAAEQRFGAAYAAWRGDPFEAELPGMEPLEGALTRAGSATAEALAASRRPLLVAHQGILRLVLISLGRIRRDQYFETFIPEAEPLELEPPDER